MTLLLLHRSVRCSAKLEPETNAEKRKSSRSESLCTFCAITHLSTLKTTEPLTSQRAQPG